MNDKSPFDRSDSPASRDKSARLILIGMGVVGVLLLILVLPPISLLSGGSKKAPSAAGTGSAATSRTPAAGSSSSASSSAGAKSKAPKPPEGFELLSMLSNVQKPKGTAGPYALTINLLAPATDGRNLALYTNRNGKWERLASGTLVQNGAAVTGQVADMPPNIAVLRRTTSAVALTGWLPPGAQPDPASLDVLGAINPVDYAPGPDGALVGAATQLPATKGGVMPTVRADAQRDADSVNAIIASPALRDAHIAALVQLAQQQPNTGIDIDYERVGAARKADFTSFITVLADKLHQANKNLSVTLPAPVKAGVSWDTAGYDWEEISKRADQIKLNGEQDPSVYYKRMEDVLNFLKPKVDLKKVALLVTRQSHEKGTDGLQAISLLDGLAIASQIEVRTATPIAPNASVVIVGKNIFQDDGASGLQWDNNALAVSFTYPGRGGQRTVWLENALSLAFRLDLAKRFGIGGVALDDVSLNPAAPAVWDVLRAYAESGSVSLVQPNGTLLKPTWQVQAGSSEAGTKGNIVWKAPPQPGAYDISLVVSDGLVRGQQKLTLTVGAPAGTPAAGGTPRPGTTTTGTPASGTPAAGTPRPTATSTPRP